MNTTMEMPCRLFHAAALAAALLSAGAGGLWGNPQISEFMAINDSSLRDEDGDTSDWIEIYNPTAAAIDLDGYALTDDPALLQKWLFPATVLNAGARLTVFASAKDRRVSGDELHTNFSLGGGGEFLALVAPDGSTLLTSFDPYPEQFADISYGASVPILSISPMLAGADCRWRVPGGEIPGWQEVGFDDSSWAEAGTGIGYERSSGGISYDPLIGVNGDVESQMYLVSGSCYVRVPFEVTSAAGVVTMHLRMKYDDGFIAYLNGTRIASALAPATPSFNSISTGIHQDADAVVFQEFDLAAQVGRLREGENILAVHALNQATNSSDLIMVPELDLVTSDPDGALAVGYYTTPSPGTPNGTSVEGFVADTRFSVDRGFYSAPISVAITTATPGATIRYTTDGSAPTATSGNVYAAPIEIATTTVLRAAAFKANFEPTNIDTHSYLFAADVRRQPSLPSGYPTTWGSDGGGAVFADYQMDPNVTNAAAYSAQIEGALTQTLPVLAIATDRNNLFAANAIYANGRDGSEEVPVSLEYFDPHSGDEFQEDAGIRLHGGNARSHPKKPFRIYFRRLYGEGELRFPLFPGSPVESFDQLILRPGGHDGWAVPFGNASTDLATHAAYMRDQFIRKTEVDLGLLSPRGKYVHLYINGLYWGVYDLHERANAQFFAAHLGGEEEDWDVYHHPSFTNQDFTLVDGDEGAYVALQNLARAGIATDLDYQSIQQYLDIDSYIDAMISRIWAGDYDWDGPIFMRNPSNPGQEQSVGWFTNKNWYCGRKSRNGAGKFHFFAWDAEMCMGNHLLVNPGSGGSPVPSWLPYPPPQRIATFDTTRVGSSGAPAFPYSKLREFPAFQVRFGDRLQKHFFNGGAMTVANNLARCEAMEAQIREAMIAESARWGDVNEGDPLGTTFTRDSHWDSEVSWLKNTYIATRNAFILDRFQAIGLFPSVAAPSFSQHGGVVPSGFALDIAAASGNIYYTEDGSDPFLPGGTGSGLLVDEGAGCDVWIPTSNVLGTSWTNLPEPANIAEWTSGNTGVGYDTSGDFNADIELDVSAMQNTNASVYVRIPFNIDSQAAIDGMTSLTLQMRYDDGFAASINGTVVQRANAIFTSTWNSAAIGTRQDVDAVQFRSFDISSFISSLRVGPNLLAIHGLNRTADGDDLLIEPRLVSTGSASAGGPSPTAVLYTGAFPLGQTGTVRARAESGGLWSALTEASFIVGVPADASNLAISEIHYRPGLPSEAEIAAGFTDRSQFEFLELLNTSADTLELAGLSFAAGIDFEFNSGAILRLAPAARLLIVSNPAAFDARYGAGFPIAGSFANATNLSNGGERLTLLDALGAPIFDFSYRDRAPWPVEPDGAGYSLVFAGNFGDAPGAPVNWRPSTQLGGNPAGDDAVSLDAWKMLNFTSAELAIAEISDDAADPDDDRLNNFLEWVFGTDPRKPNAAPVTISLEPLVDGVPVPGDYATFSVQMAAGVAGIRSRLDASADLASWSPGVLGTSYQFLGSTPGPGNSRILAFRTSAPATPAVRQSFRFVFESR